MTGPAPAVTLVVFARAPVAGQVKTRLFRPADPAVSELRRERALGPEDAARLYAAFVADVLQKGAQAGFARRRLYVEGSLEHAALVEPARQHGYLLRPQSGGDLGSRLHAAVSAELEAGASAVVVIGSDSPTLPLAYLRQAQELLAGPAGVVLGPATDGGYYLIGMKGDLGWPQLFAPGVRWSTAEVLPVTLERLAQLQQADGRARPALLPFFYDCDTPEDIRLLCAHLKLGAQAEGAPLQAPHTLQALRELSLL